MGLFPYFVVTGWDGHFLFTAMLLIKFPRMAVRAVEEDGDPGLSSPSGP